VAATAIGPDGAAVSTLLVGAGLAASAVGCTVSLADPFAELDFSADGLGATSGTWPVTGPVAAWVVATGPVGVWASAAWVSADAGASVSESAAATAPPALLTNSAADSKQPPNVVRQFVIPPDLLRQPSRFDVGIVPLRAAQR